MKRPKNWYCLTEDEKLEEELYFQYNTSEIIRILNKIINKKKLTKIQGNFIEILFTNFRQEELDFYEIHGEYLINFLDYSDELEDLDEIDMSDCPF